MNSVFVTGGTGYMGSLLVGKLLDSGADRVVSYSRRWAGSERLMHNNFYDSHLRCINGDIRDYDTLVSAMRGCNYVIHAAAYKSVPSAEYNPVEATTVNVNGTVNVARAAIENKAEKVLFISSDKAANAINLYGRTKALGESIIVNSNNLGQTRFSVTRYGNIVNSTGSVVPYFKKLIREGKTKLPITIPSMTRFWFAPDNAAEYVLGCLKYMIGGETFVPHLKSSRLIDLYLALEKIYNLEGYNIAGARPGEKKHETMITEDEAWRTINLGWTYVIKPFQHDWDSSWRVKGSQFLNESYTSENADRYMVDELVELIK